ncbi:hypothetical protein Pcinc_005547 [Petrolisthes cinctipes]|uniref:Uncharacterized protein n=1 Tax=Petrolisthes cinctipes TaxID=88211 RepID=A0AAE1L0F1_PETCI|nr:hypothetical protein Pcinc_005547 [Petrolisthes cinctipes]
MNANQGRIAKCGKIVTLHEAGYTPTQIGRMRVLFTDEKTFASTFHSKLQIWRKIGTGRQDRGSASTIYGYDTAWEVEEVANESGGVLQCVDLPLCPVCMSTEDHQYAARDNEQESSNRMPALHSSNSASSPSSCIATPSSSRLATYQSLLEILSKIRDDVRDAADSLRSIA